MFATILPSGEKVEIELSPVEREFVNVKEGEFSKLGLYRKKQTNEATLYRLFQLAQSGNKQDYAACVFAINHFYNFGVKIEHRDFTNRWLATAVETGRIDEAVQIVKLWNTWLPCPPRIELVEILIGMVNIAQSRDLLASVRQNWQMPLSGRAYNIVIAKELSTSDPAAPFEAFIVWKDAQQMNVSLSVVIQESLQDRLLKAELASEADEVGAVLQTQSID